MTPEPWADGYIVDVEYTHGFYRRLAPAALRFVTLLGRVQAVDTEAPFTYYELGCGQGYTSALLAAANPHGRFFGVDFNPAHVHSAQQLARAGGVDNVQFLEKSFAELGDMDLPAADVIALHGVWSWIAQENRRHLIEFIRQRLKPAGVVYASYNCLPGLSQVAPLQRLLLEHSRLGTGDPIERMRRSLDFALRFDAGGAHYFAVSPVAKVRLSQLGEHDPSYLVHEYLTANWAPFYHADVVKDMAAAKLSYVASANLIDNFDQLLLKPELAKLVAEVPDPVLAETIKDFARNQGFRMDVFTRGAPKASAPELEAMLDRTRFALARPRSTCRFKTTTSAGDVTLQEEAYAPVLDALARGAMSFAELTRAPEISHFERPRLRQALFGMAALGNVLPALPAAGEEARRAATAKFNNAVLSRPVAGPLYTWLASPVLGSGVPLDFIDRMLLQAPRDEKKALDHARTVMAGREEREVLEDRVRLFFNHLLPFLRQLGVLNAKG